MISVLLRCLPVSLRKRWGLDESEQRFLELVKKSAEFNRSDSGPSILIQMPKDYFCLGLFSVAVYRLKPSLIGGLWHQSIFSNPRHESWTEFRNQFRKLARYLDRRKWTQLYGSNRLDETWDLEPEASESVKNRLRASKIFHKLSSKQDLLDLEIDGIPCGDLIYDTYLRYRVQPTVDLQDFYLCHLIERTLDAMTAARAIFANGRYQIFLTNYSSYIQHGIPVRVALELGVDVYSAGNLSQFFKKLLKTDTLHTTAHWVYKKRFQSIEDQFSARSQAAALLEHRFAGGIDDATSYMKTSAFTDSVESVPAGVEGVMFLHDFFDSPHCHRWMLFADFLEWARFTLRVIQDHQLPIAFKPHPNQFPESHKVVLQLQSEFPRIRWLSSNLSNRVIFNSGIRCGVSVYGTVLHELAYHGIPGLAAGDHPHTAFDIATTPRTIEEYRSLLLSFRDLKLSTNVKNEVLDFCYMHNICVDEGLELSFKGLGLRDIGPNVSRRLGQFLNRHPHFPDFNLN